MAKEKVNLVMVVSNDEWDKARTRQRKRQEKRMKKEDRRWCRHAKNRDKHGTT